MTYNEKYEAVIGLEVHAQLTTKSKIFTSDEVTYGAPPNTLISAITFALPGTLPKFNKEALELAIKMGIACNCDITEVNHFARKNYFYPDLPKGYQISQDKTPICVNGHVEIEIEGETKQIILTRIHLEEDAGKNNHELDPYYSLIDLNRAGTPLIEIVSEPVIKSADEAYQYLTEVRKLVRYLEVCDGNMEEGSLRCDANISIRLKGEKELGTKVEVKNMNSIRNVKRAIEGEILRQIDIVENGGSVDQETRSFNANDGSTFTLRSKEYAHDYRYFPEPDLPPVVVTQTIIEDIKKRMPPLPKELMNKYIQSYGLNSYDAQVLTDEKEIALYFDEMTNHTQNYKAAANWVMGAIKSYLNENALSINDFKLSPKQIADIIQLIDNGKLSSAGAKKVFDTMASGTDESPVKFAERLNLIQESDENALLDWAKEALAKYPEKVEEYKSGKKGLIGLFMGEVMKISKGKADPKLATQMLNELLNK
jgi:aspartyl-tRNA(Asn)/glutamyl-tRNA(Gln) amidotransferase subunit B